MKTEPAVPDDGTCAYCGGVRVMPTTKQKGVPIEAYLQDPFCSNKCAKAYYGTQDAPPDRHSPTSMRRR